MHVVRNLYYYDYYKIALSCQILSFWTQAYLLISSQLFYRCHAKVPDKACKYWANYRRIQWKEGSGNQFPYVSVVMTCKAYQLLLYNNSNNGFMPLLASWSRKALWGEFLYNCLEISLQMKSTSALYLKCPYSYIKKQDNQIQNV